MDPDFAECYTAVAFTKNFQGSPHIDTQNSGPFYGLALGDFRAVVTAATTARAPSQPGESGTTEEGKEGVAEDEAGKSGGGALCVECSALEVAHVDTRNKLGRVDGRYPHWVAPYQGTCTGSPFTKVVHS